MLRKKINPSINSSFFCIPSKRLTSTTLQECDKVLFSLNAEHDDSSDSWNDEKKSEREMGV